MKTLTINDVLYINKQTIIKHGGTHGVKNLSLIESSLNSGLATFDGIDLSDLRTVINHLIGNLPFDKKIILKNIKNNLFYCKMNFGQLIYK